MARYRRAHFLCRPFVMYGWNGKGRMDGGAGVAMEERWERGRGWGVMNSWPIPSRMPSNLCHKEGHPSHRQAAVLYTTAPTWKHKAHMPDSHSQRAQKTLLHPQV